MVTEYRTPTAIVRVHQPELTEEERAKRMKRIEEAAIRLVLDAYEKKAQKKGEIA